MSRRFDDVQVGALVLAALGVLIVGSLWIAGRGIRGAPHATYRVHLEDSSGLSPGADVRVAGLRVGRIDDPRLDADDARWPVSFRLVLQRPVALHEDATASVATDGFFGDPFLDLEPGAAPSPAIADGGDVWGRPGAGGLDEGLAAIGEIGDQAGELLARTTALVEELTVRLPQTFDRLDAMLSAENAESIGRLLDRADHTLAETAPKLTALLDRLDALAAEAQLGLEPMPELFARLDGLTADLQTALGPDGQRLTDVLVAAQSTLGSAEQGMGVLTDNREQLESLMRDLDETMDNLKGLSQTLEERPFSLIRIRADPERKPGGGR